MQEASQYTVLKFIENEPEISQRELAKRMSVSVGKVNYCLKALIDKGFIKLNRFHKSDNKLAYAYVLTPSGIEQKTRLTLAFLRYKEAEYEQIKQEIADLRQALCDTPHPSPSC